MTTHVDVEHESGTDAASPSSMAQDSVSDDKPQPSSREDSDRVFPRILTFIHGRRYARNAHGHPGLATVGHLKANGLMPYLRHKGGRTFAIVAFGPDGSDTGYELLSVNVSNRDCYCRKMGVRLLRERFSELLESGLLFPRFNDKDDVYDVLRDSFGLMTALADRPEEIGPDGRPGQEA